MTTLVEALQATSWHFLITIGRRRRLKLDSNLPKAALIDILSRTLVQPDNLRPALAGLSAPARQLLVDLQLAGGRVARRHLAAAYGRLRPAGEIIRALRQQARTPETAAQPAQTAFSPLEEVTLLGLVFLQPAADDLFIPVDMLPLLPAPPALPPPTPARQARPIAPADLVCHDLAYLFGLLQRDDVAPRHGRWLPPNLLLAWGRGCLGPIVHPQARGELQTGRRRFLHYLAENAGWLNVQLAMNNTHRALREQTGKKSDHAPRSTPHAPRSPLTPTPAAWLWLDASPQERRQALWQSWLSPDPARWRAFRLPGSTWLSRPEALLVVIHNYLPRLDPADPAQFARLLLARQPELLDLLPANLLEPVELLAETIIQLLTGPLVWLGVLWNDELRMRNACPERSRRDEDAASALTLTRQGLAWLTGQTDPADPLPPPAKFSITTDFQPDPFESTLTLTLGDGLPDPPDLVVALEVTEAEQRSEEEKQRRGRGAREQGSESPLLLCPLAPLPSFPLPNLPVRLHRCYQITAASFIKTLQRGWSPPALLDALNRLADRPLTGQETALLRIWADAAGKMTIHPAVILETVDPAIISRLAATRRGRALIHRTLSPRAVIVDPARLDQLVRRLTEQEGVPPKVQGSRGAGERGSEGEKQRKGRGAEEQGSESPLPLRSLAPLLNSPLPLRPLAPLPLSSAGHFWLVIEVYQRLGQLIRLPVRIPQSVLDQLSPQLTPTDLAAADIAAGQVLAALEQAIAGRAAFPPWSGDNLPVEETLPLIETALRDGLYLELDYYSAGRDELTHRLVEPYRLEWRGRAGAKADPTAGTPYLVGFCQRAQAERVFRVDRIRTIVLVPAPDD